MEVRQLRTAADIGVVLATGFGDFDVIVAQTPDSIPVMCYGVLNKATGIIETITNNFARAKAIAGEFAREAKEGYQFPQNPLDAMFGGDDAPLPGSKKLS